MKKRLLTIAAIGTAMCCLSACSKTDDSGKYDALNSMLDANYSQIAITVTDTFNENTSLKSEYIIKYSDSEISVEYSVEKFSEISLDNPSTNLKTTLTGDAVIKDGSLTFNGDDVGITLDIARLPFTFKKSYFKNTYLKNDYIKADINNVSAFFGQDIKCTNMTMWATFIEVFYRMEISYTSANGNSVQYIYVFKI